MFCTSHLGGGPYNADYDGDEMRLVEPVGHTTIQEAVEELCRLQKLTVYTKYQKGRYRRLMQRVMFQFET
jgi:hypothetical protein